MRSNFGFLRLLLLAASGTALASNVNLNGAGATFPFPLYSKWMFEYNKVNPNIRINYQSIGSGGGIRQISDRTVDFGASDAPMTDEQLAKAPAKLVHIPTTLGAVVVTYELPGNPKLKLTPEVLAGIYLGQITTWNDKRVVELNSGVNLPAQPITVAHRSDGSGTTAVFTDYLCKVSPTWNAKVGKGTSVMWPVGLGGKGNEGVTGQVKTTPGSLGYVELAYAVENKLPYASIRNLAGTFVEPSIDSIVAAAASLASTIPADFRVSITNAPGPQSYPLASFTYLLVYEDMPDHTKAEALAKFIWWAEHDGQKFSGPLRYAPLPPELVTKVEAKLKTLRSAGQPLLATN
jgi:phosphate transport system substrate-binding protein